MSVGQRGMSVTVNYVCLVVSGMSVAVSGAPVAVSGVSVTLSGLYTVGGVSVENSTSMNVNDVLVIVRTVRGVQYLVSVSVSGVPVSVWCVCRWK